jgi:hypothetical protein
LRPVYHTAGWLSLVAAAYGATGVAPSPLITFGFSVGPAAALLVWARRDARALRVPLAYDWAFLALALWFVALPWYAVATRGWRGVALLARVLGALVAPPLVWALLAGLRSVRPS